MTLDTPEGVDIRDGLDAFALQFKAQLEKAGLPGNEYRIHEHTVHFCLALGLQAAYRFDPGSIVFERPIGHGRTDLYVVPFDMAIEVKFWRPNPGGRSRAATNLFGALLADFNRLARFESVRRFVVFVTDSVGLGYLQKSAHGLLPLSPASPQIIPPQDVDGLRKTARDRAVKDDSWLPLAAEFAWEKLCGDWHLLAWRVTPIQSG